MDLFSNSMLSDEGCPEYVDFTVIYEGQELAVSVHIVQQHTIYFIQYPDDTPSLKLFRAKGIESPTFWTSIPEDIRRAKESEEIGALIFAYYQSIKK